VKKKTSEAWGRIFVFHGTAGLNYSPPAPFQTAAETPEVYESLA
jgi:hypothetical protein